MRRSLPCLLLSSVTAVAVMLACGGDGKSGRGKGGGKDGDTGGAAEGEGDEGGGRMASIIPDDPGKDILTRDEPPPPPDESLPSAGTEPAAEEEPAAAKLIDSPLYFGGMYGQKGGGWHVNPLTGDATCPAGYTATPALGTLNVDHMLFFCHAPVVAGTTPLVLFGGMYSLAAPQYANQSTGAPKCPDGFTTSEAYGTGGVDHSLFYCHKPYTADAPWYMGFAGMSGGKEGGVYPNPATGDSSCPAGYRPAHVLGTQGLDYPVYYCMK